MFISLHLAKKRTKETSYRNLRFLKAPPFSRRAGAAELALWERNPPPFCLRPALLGQNLSRAPLRSFVVSIGSRREVFLNRLRWDALACRGSKAVGGILAGEENPYHLFVGTGLPDGPKAKE